MCYFKHFSEINSVPKQKETKAIFYVFSRVCHRKFPQSCISGICIVLASGEMYKCKWIFCFKSLEIMYFHVVVKTLASVDGKYQV